MTSNSSLPSKKALIFCLGPIALLWPVILTLYSQKSFRFTLHGLIDWQNPLGLTSNAFNNSKIYLCRGNDCTIGRWTPRKPPHVSIDDAIKHYDGNQSNYSVWDFSYLSTGASKEDKFVQEQYQRLINITNWIWEPNQGRMHSWNAEDFVIRMLRSSGGIIFVGDSLTEHHYMFLHYLLGRAGIELDMDPPHLLHSENEMIHEWVLRPNHFMTKVLMERAGTPPSRLIRPIFTRINNPLLIGENDARPLLKNVGARDFPWIDGMAYMDGWETYIREAATPKPGEKLATSEDTVLLMNAGAHWSRKAFFMLPQNGTKEETQARLSEVYRQMVDVITSRLSAIEDLSVYYRSTSPAHPDCNLFKNPYHDSGEARISQRDLFEQGRSLPHRPEFGDWDWDLFGSYNLMWRQAIEELNLKRYSQHLKGAEWFYMDIWNMTLQRPDAHTQQPGGLGPDCLHYCPAGVMEQWSYFLHHLLIERSNVWPQRGME
ncbi:hypothetical protein BDQ12DRAFT_594552 [Crucibulum laeve]|uniref:Trichome birefringence-like C-terminal domain-containing protein n=1 Tax=Crucibulum laeve TaxID=68775 RepID=A0A5C3MFB4_9AGAR|nr:hypothetical protein BDQ12DRAFT_594552 [Crucibulum laeve]